MKMRFINFNLACQLLPITTIDFRHPLSIIICLLAGIGILISFFVVYIFVRFNATPVVKSTTRELSYLILTGILFCHLTAFVILQKPSFIICVLTRLLPGISFSMIYGSLVTKTNRIARILARSKKKIITRRLKFMSARHQLAIACIILVTEITIVGKILFPKGRRRNQNKLCFVIFFPSFVQASLSTETPQKLC